MKKLIALLVSASVIGSTVAMAEDSANQATQGQDATAMSQSADNSQAADPVKGKKHHHKKMHHKHHAKKAEAAPAEATSAASEAAAMSSAS